MSNCIVKDFGGIENGAEIVEKAKRLANPVTYAEDVLGLRLHPKQAAVCRDLFSKKGSRVSFRCSNEVGKTASVATTSILYALDILNAQVISTAGVWMQVVSQLVPSLRAHQHKFPSWRFNESSINIGGVNRYVGFSTRDEGFAQGFHKREGMPLLAIIDEAAAVQDQIYDGVEDRCNPDYFLVMGSPLDPAGRFYDIETRLSRFYTHHTVNQMECLTTDGYWLDPLTIERKIAKYGSKDHPFILSNVFGEFAKRVQNALLSLGEFNACLATPPEHRPGYNDRHAFVDVAGGGDANVFAVRQGNKVWIVKKWVESSEMATCGEIVAIMKRLQREIGLRPQEVSIDASGAGKPMADRLREMGYELHRFTGQSRPQLDMDYKNAISEVWGSGAAKIRACDMIIPNDDEFRSQVLSRQLKRDSKGKFQIEPKEDYCGRGFPSPDEADAIFGAMMPAVNQGRVNLIEQDVFDDRGWVERASVAAGRFDSVLPAESCL